MKKSRKKNPGNLIMRFLGKWLIDKPLYAFGYHLAKNPPKRPKKKEEEVVAQ